MQKINKTEDILEKKIFKTYRWLSLKEFKDETFNSGKEAEQTAVKETILMMSKAVQKQDGDYKAREERRHVQNRRSMATFDQNEQNSFPVMISSSKPLPSSSPEKLRGDQRTHRPRGVRRAARIAAAPPPCKNEPLRVNDK